MLRFFNPYALPTGSAAKAAQHGPAVDTWLKTQTGNKVITMAELRIGLPLIAGDLSRAVVNQILHNLGIEIENPEDPAA